MIAFCYYVVIVLFVVFLIAIIVAYFLSASSRYAMEKEGVLEGSPTGEALPFKLGLAYGLWFGLCFLASYVSDKLSLNPEMIMGNQFIVVLFAIFFYLLCYLTVHMACVFIGHAHPRLAKITWL
ncbi:hypothetical protein C0584_03370 [Candidatus Parcubacteria bacterium]|nr:MAG: hypothetical protein C0584_03370 [Candidatus Parcubacteria bacterium]